MRSRVILASTVALLLAQCWFIPRFGEPYPAVTMPSFSGSGAYRDGVVSFRNYEAVFIAEGREFPVAPEVLLAEFPDSHHGTIARNVLRPGGEPAVRTGERSRMGRLRDAVFPGLEAWRSAGSTGEKNASLRSWLRRRALAVVPDHQVSRVELRWYRESVRLEGGAVRVERHPEDTLVVPLHGSD
jgi:hypothetical protein